MAELITPDEAIGLIDRLVDKSLVVWEEGRGYRLLHTVREFGREHLRESDDYLEVKLRHYRFYCEFAKHTDDRIRGPEQRRWYALYSQLFDDFRAALEFGFSRPELTASTSELTFDLTAFWFNVGRFREAVGYYARALAVCPPGDSDLRARLMRRGGMMLAYHGDPAGVEMMGDALSIAQRIGSEQTLADAYFSLALVLEDSGVAISHLRKALALFERLDDRTGVAYSFGCLGEAVYTEGSLDEARPYFEQSLTRALALGDTRSAGTSTASLGTIQMDRGNTEEARRLFTQALDMVLETGAVFSVYSMFPLITEFVARQGHAFDAARLLGWSERIRLDAGGIRDRMDQFVYDRTHVFLKQALGEPVVSALCEEGMRFSQNEAISLTYSRLR